MIRNIRKFQNSDLGYLNKLINETIDICYRGIYSGKAIDFFKNYHSNDCILEDAQRGYTVVLENENGLMGTGTLLGHEIKRVFVLHEFQNKGLGKIVMNALEQKALGARIDSVELHSSLLATKFYTSIGYSTRRDGFIDLGGDGSLNYSEMVKNLTITNSVSFHNKTFKVIRNDGPGAEVTQDTIFYFKQEGSVIHADYSGGNVNVGKFLGVIENDVVQFKYLQINKDGEFNSGKSTDQIIVTNDGKIQLLDTWEWETKDGKGFCILEEA